MLSDEQIEDATVFLAEMLMEAVQAQARKQSYQMIADFSQKEMQLPEDTLMTIDYQIVVPLAVVKRAIDKTR